MKMSSSYHQSEKKFLNLLDDFVINVFEVAEFFVWGPNFLDWYKNWYLSVLVAT